MSSGCELQEAKGTGGAAGVPEAPGPRASWPGAAGVPEAEPGSPPPHERLCLTSDRESSTDVGIRERSR